MICSKFDNIANLLEKRHANKVALRIEDDVQYLLNGLLALFFDDIRPEEWNPSFAGSSSRSPLKKL